MKSFGFGSSQKIVNIEEKPIQVFELKNKIFYSFLRNGEWLNNREDCQSRFY